MLAARASRYPPEGERSWGPFAPLWGGAAPDPAAANAAVRCLVMVETVGALADVDAIAATPGVDGLFVGPFDLALALGTTVDALLDDRSDGNPLGGSSAAAERHGILVAGFAGTPANARRLRAHGIQCLAVTTDLAVVAEGVAPRCSDADDAGSATSPARTPGTHPGRVRRGQAGWPLERGCGRTAARRRACRRWTKRGGPRCRTMTRQ